MEFDKEEYLKCKDDVAYFANTYIQYNAIDGVKKFEPYPYQNELMNENGIIASTSRQIGFSLMSYIKIVHSIIFKQNKSILFWSLSRDRTSYVLSEIKLLLDLCTIPNYLKPKCKINNKQQLIFDNGNRINGIVNYIGMKGYSLDELYIEEFDYIKEDIDTIKISISPALFLAEVVWVWSSPSNNNIYKLRDILKNNLKFKFYQLPYWIINRNYDWRNNTISIIGKNMFDKEYKI